MTPQVYVLRCGNCPFVITTMRDERAKAWMLDHLQDAHTTDGHLRLARAVCDTGSSHDRP